jgi:serine/threonine protein kinase
MESVPDDWLAVEWGAGLGDGIFITILYHSKRFHVSLLPPSTPDTVEGPLISRFDSTADEDILAIQDEIGKIVYDAGESIWDQLAPALPDNEKPSDLHSILYPEAFSFLFVTNNGKAELTKGENEDVLFHDGLGMKIVNDMGLPQYSSRDIRVLEIFAGQSHVTQVMVDGREMCCKSGDDWFFRAMEREFDCLRKVALSDISGYIRVPRLLSLVTSAESGKTIGILEEYIPTGELSNLRLLGDEGMEASTQRRKKWGAQIRETVDLLHNIGVIWGDGKPHNVLIHQETDDAWVIDFGGGYTEGWVDQELLETLEGDEQVVGKIHDFLGI